MSNTIFIDFGPLLIYFIIWYILAIPSVGLTLPLGLFVSGILIGCAFGRIFGLFVQTYIIPELHIGSYSLIGAVSILAGYARHTFSLSVIMLECTQQINMFIPVVFSVLIAFYLGDVYNKSIYIIGVRTKNIPFLGEFVPHKVNKVTANTMMKCPVRILPPIATVRDISRVLQVPIVHGFPIVENEDYVEGLISREAIMILLDNKCWITRDENSDYNNKKDSKI